MSERGLQISSQVPSRGCCCLSLMSRRGSARSSNLRWIPSSKHASSTTTSGCRWSRTCFRATAVRGSCIQSPIQVWSAFGRSWSPECMAWGSSRLIRICSRGSAATSPPISYRRT
jgi:hypothetical protein